MNSTRNFLKFTAFFFLMTYCQFIKSQSVVKVDSLIFRDNKLIEIIYRIHKNPNNTHLIQLFGSKDGFSYPLQAVSGEVNKQVSPGVNKKIIWKPKEEETYYSSENGYFNGEIKLKVLATPQFINIKKRYRKGNKPHLIQWTGGGEDELLILEFKDPSNGNWVKIDEQFKNVYQKDWIILENIKAKKSSFRLKNVRSDNQRLISETQSFKISPKFPYKMFLAPLIALGAAGVYLILDEEDTPSLPQPTLADPGD